MASTKKSNFLKQLLSVNYIMNATCKIRKVILRRGNIQLGSHLSAIRNVMPCKWFFKGYNKP